MAETVYVGLAVSSHNPKAAATAVFDNFRITNADAPPNQPPAVILNSPAQGQAFTAPATLTVTAFAADHDGSISSVEFYANATLLGRDLSAPYEVTAHALPQGTYALKAVATDDLGASTVSESVTIKVSNNADEPPATGGPPRGVVFTASKDHDTLVISYVLEIHADGTTPGKAAPVATSDLGKPFPRPDGDVIVERLEFFRGLAPGSYIATVVAVGRTDTARSKGVKFSR